MRVRENKRGRTEYEKSSYLWGVNASTGTQRILPFFQNDQMQATFGGGEANVAVSLANYGLNSVYVTKLQP